MARKIVDRQIRPGAMPSRTALQGSQDQHRASSRAQGLTVLGLLHREPTRIVEGTLAIADGTNWDPASLSFNAPYAVILDDNKVWQPTVPIITGNFTPVLTDLTNTDATVTTAFGAYYRIVNLIFFTLYLNISSLGTISGNIYIKGLPVTAKNETNNAPSVNCGFSTNLNITADQSISGAITPNTKRIALYLWDTITGSTPLQASEYSSNGQIFLSGMYMA